MRFEEFSFGKIRIDGVTYGPVHTHSGWIGLRQMSHADYGEYGHLTVYRLR